MSKYCGVCADNRVYLDAVPVCPECGGALRRWNGGTQTPEHAVTETDVQPHILQREPASDPLPWLVAALVILVLAAIMMRT